MSNPFVKMGQMLGGDTSPVMAADEQKYRRLAQLLAQQDTPQGQMVSGHYVAPSWTQHLAKLLGTAGSAYEANKADQAAEQGRKDFSDTARKYVAALQGTPTQYAVSGQQMPNAAAAQDASAATDNTASFNPAQAPVAPNMAMYDGSGPQSQPGGNTGPFADMAHNPTAVPVNSDPMTSVPSYAPVTTTPGTQGDPNAALRIALESNSPQFQQFAVQQAMAQAQPQKPMVVGRTLMDQKGNVIGVDSTWRDEQAAQRAQKMEELQARLADQKLSRQDHADLMRELAQQRAAQAGQPYYQFIGTPQGIVTGNARTGQLTLGNLGGSPVMKSSDSPQLQSQITQAKHAGGALGDAEGTLGAAQGSLPQVEQTVKQLKQIGKDATYTYAGRARDAVARQVGVATPGAVAREKYVQTVRDVLFPQLRATFGAQFTVKEGEALVATLGDPNKTPAERNAALDAFIEQKREHIQSLQRQTGKPVTQFSAPAGGAKFLGFE